MLFPSLFNWLYEGQIRPAKIPEASGQLPVSLYCVPCKTVEYRRMAEPNSFRNAKRVWAEVRNFSFPGHKSLHSRNWSTSLLKPFKYYPNWLSQTGLSASHSLCIAEVLAFYMASSAHLAHIGSLPCLPSSLLLMLKLSSSEDNKFWKRPWIKVFFPWIPICTGFRPHWLPITVNVVMSLFLPRLAVEVVGWNWFSGIPIMFWYYKYNFLDCEVDETRDYKI